MGDERNEVLVCGGRDYDNWQHVYAVLDAMHAEKPITAIIHGAARGADQLAGAWAIRNRVLVRRFPADWKRHGKGAGPIRNQRMLDEGRPDSVVAFPGGRGTADMVRRSLLANVRVFECYDPEAFGARPTLKEGRDGE